MFFVRLVGVLLLAAIGVLLGAYLATRDRRYLGWVKLVIRLAIVLAIVFFALYAAERLILVI
jgi:hypothetical protein